MNEKATIQEIKAMVEADQKAIDQIVTNAITHYPSEWAVGMIGLLFMGQQLISKKLLDVEAKVEEVKP